jgi:hypothetical protein
MRNASFAAAQRNSCKICDDNGGTNRVGCRYRPCTYAIVERTSGALEGAPAGAAEAGISWSQALMIACDNKEAITVGWDQETATPALPDRAFECSVRPNEGVTNLAGLFGDWLLREWLICLHRYPQHRLAAWASSGRLEKSHGRL